MANRARGAENRQLFNKVGDFLGEHQLDPTPENYALIFELLTNAASPASRAVLEATSDGLRLTQAEASRILSEHGVERAMERGGVENAAVSAARRQVADFALMVDATRMQAQDYGRELAGAAAELQAQARDGSVADLVRITGAMLERTKVAERQLAQAREEAQRLREQLAEAEEEARSDPLTELPNRRAFEDRLAKVLETGQSHSIALCDIDRFKVINDSHGHSVGDRVLKMVAEVLEGSCGGHLVARFGGEEFVVLFEELDAAAAAELLDEARLDLAARNFRVRETDEPLGRVTFSAGIAWSGAGGMCDGLLQRADALLYQAKNGGRNQVRCEGEAAKPAPVMAARG